jgi:Fe-S cluster biogenesis protein NfuA
MSAEKNTDKPEAAKDWKAKVDEILEKVRPGLQMDGGDVELVGVDDDGTVRVRLKGACAGCPMATMTLHGWIERELKTNIPEVKKVEAVS